ncbi:hypothetical protein AHiyo4_07720 [Arthrobacter sp. Hiyo4]|nr:hypothetical protein AHiyo4_07720 [Arthrobacter sp. Hiyo4]
MSTHKASPALADSQWWHDGMATIAELARTDRTFTCFDVAKAGVTEPSRPQHWALLMAAARRAGIIHADGSSASRRPSSRRTAVTSWIGLQGPAADLPLEWRRRLQKGNS